MLTIDLNCDMGEFEDQLERDARICAHVSSINLACGGHAGTRDTMQSLCETARRLGVSVGAHPSYPDRAGFGRRPIEMSLEALRGAVAEQCASLAAVARDAGVVVTHVKAHGALYHTVMDRPASALAVLGAVRATLGDVTFFIMSGAPTRQLLEASGAHLAREGFADRRYAPGGTLIPRSTPGALLETDQAVEQATSLVLHGQVLSRGGAPIPLVCDTICLHSDDTESEARVAAVSAALRAQSITIQPFTGPAQHDPSSPAG